MCAKVTGFDTSFPSWFAQWEFNRDFDTTSRMMIQSNAWKQLSKRSQISDVLFGKWLWVLFTLWYFMTLPVSLSFVITADISSAILVIPGSFSRDGQLTVIVAYKAETLCQWTAEWSIQHTCLPQIWRPGGKPTTGKISSKESNLQTDYCTRCYFSGSEGTFIFIFE